MATKTLLSVFLACLVLSGCPHPYQRTQKMENGSSRTYVKPLKRAHCPGDTCIVNVSVDINNHQTPVSVDKELLVINTGKKKRTSISWILGDSKYSFDPDRGGIDFLDDDKKEFVDCKQGASPQIWICVNKHEHFGVYKYTINVRGQPPLDPWVVND